jgi:MFS family permease
MSDAATTLTRPVRGAWLVWGVGAASFAYAFLQRVSPSVMVEDLMRDFAVSGAILGNLSAIYFYVYAILQIPVGVALDNWGPRRMLTAAAAIAATGSVLLASADTLSIAYVGRLLVGVGCAVGFVGSLKIATNWFPSNRFAFVTGMSMLAGMAGGVIGQAPMAALVDAVGWRDALLVAGALALAIAAASWFIVRDRPTGVAGGAEPAPRRSVVADLKQVVARPQNWIVAFFGAAMSAPMLAYGGLWGVPHLMQTYGLDRPAAAGSASVLMLGWAAGAPLSGWASDRFGRRRPPMAIAAAISLACWLVLLYVPGLPLAVAWLLLFAIGASSAGMVIGYAVARESSPVKVSGAATGFVNTAAVGSGALMQPLVGWLLDVNWDGTLVDGVRLYSAAAYDVALITMPVCAAASFVAVWLIRETFCRPLDEL